nr:hypothetical protein GCM10020093_065960 [Planobispora longispora]
MTVGTVQRVEDGKVYVQTMDGSVVTVNTTGETTVRVSREEGRRSAGRRDGRRPGDAGRGRLPDRHVDQRGRRPSALIVLQQTLR